MTSVTNVRWISAATLEQIRVTISDAFVLGSSICLKGLTWVHAKDLTSPWSFRTNTVFEITFWTVTGPENLLGFLGIPAPNLLVKTHCLQLGELLSEVSGLFSTSPLFPASLYELKSSLAPFLVVLAVWFQFAG
jgi:hypothetical protein